MTIRDPNLACEGVLGFESVKFPIEELAARSNWPSRGCLHDVAWRVIDFF